MLLNGRDLLALTEAQMREVRGGEMAMIFQEPATSLNPVLSVGRQIGEVLARHGALRGAAARDARANCSTRSAFPMRGGVSKSIPSSSPAA
ncbi:hypothetical protein MASR1M97_02760 [Candidatus Desulfobacillus denitrificans]